MDKPVTFLKQSTLGVGLLALAVQATYALDPADVQLMGTSMRISAPIVTNIANMQATVIDPNGDVVLETETDGKAIDWVPALDAPDGGYRYEVIVVTYDPAADSGEEDGANGEEISTVVGDFTVENGQLVETTTPTVPDAEESQSFLDRVQDGIESLAINLIDTLIPKAHAQNVEADSTFPGFLFDDTNVADPLEYGIFANDTGTHSFFGIYNYNASGYMFNFSPPSNSNSTNTMTLNTLGDIGFAGNGIWIDRSAQRMGIGTTGPAHDLEIQSSTPGIRFDDESSTAYDMELQLNNTSLELEGTSGQDIMDIYYNASGNTFVIDSASEVGIGTGSPSSKLHVVSNSAGNAGQIYMQNINASPAERVLFRLNNDAGGKTRFLIDSAANQWTFDNDGLAFNISYVGTGLNEFRVTNTGNGFFRGNVFANGVLLTSDRDAKEGFEDVDERDVLDKVLALPISEWQYKSDEEQERHIGPVAQDFQRLFERGDGKTISMVDASGIAFAAIQGLNQVVQEKDAEIASLEQRITALEAQTQRVAALETVVATLLEQNNAATMQASLQQ